ncbi:MAG: M23 family metallopeptidase [Pseudomonadota bacterium]
MTIAVMPALAWSRTYPLIVCAAACFGACRTSGTAPSSQVIASGAPPVSLAEAAAPAPLVADAGSDAPPSDATAARNDDTIGRAPAPLTTANPTTSLRLPWTGGETWYLTSGPHSHNRAALDFAPPNFDPRTAHRFPNACSRQRGNAHWVRAAAAGRISAVLRRDCPIVQIEHGDGTTTNYFHLQRRSVRALRLKVGDPVEAGQILGHPSCETGPKVCGATHQPSGVHVHFYRTAAAVTDAKRLPADGMVLSGWEVHAVGRIREGTMTKGGEVRSARGNAVGCACSPTMGMCGGQRNDLESDNVASAPSPAVTVLPARSHGVSRRLAAAQYGGP